MFASYARKYFPEVGNCWVEIIDTDFTEEVAQQFHNGITEVIKSVIEVYERRNLPVAPNIFKAIVYLSKNSNNFPIDAIIRHNTPYLNPRYVKYADEVEKYILLL